MEKDWRLINQEKYLSGKKLVKKEFVTRGTRDHAHCAFCWDKFGQKEGWIHIGYCTCDEQHWICEQCFQDFKERFGWQVVSADEENNDTYQAKEG